MFLTHGEETGVGLGWRILLFLGITVAVMLAASLVVPTGSITGGAAATLVAALVAGGLLLRLHGRGPGALGFHLAPSAPREVVLGGAVGVGLAVGVVAVMTALGGVAWSREAGSLAAWAAGAVGALGLLALPAAAEEALLRGYPLQALAQKWGAGWGLLLTSALFGVMHRANPGATALGTATTAAAGLFLGAVYLRTGSLWWATGAHLGWNWGIGYLADLPVSGLEVMDAPWVGAMPRGPDWLGGGAFGPEGSGVATVGFLVAAALCWWGPWLRPEPAALAARPLALRIEDGTQHGGVGAAPRIP